MSEVGQKSDMRSRSSDVRYHANVRHCGTLATSKLIVQPCCGADLNLFQDIVFDNVIKPEACCETFTILSCGGLTFFGIE